MEAEAVPRREDFSVAIICALPLEGKAVQKYINESKGWTVEEVGGKADNDQNVYTLGRIGNTLVVLVWMAEMGKATAISAARDLYHSFRCIKFAFVVGICGGVPTARKDKEIVLGDVVISTGLKEYDKGKRYHNAYCSSDAPTKAQTNMRALLNKMEGGADSQELEIACDSYLKHLLDKNDDYATEARYPGPQEDLLYQSTYVHRHHNPTHCHCVNPDEQCYEARDKDCFELQCDKSSEQLVYRRRLQDPSNHTSPSIHFGIVGSGDTVMKSGKHRDELANKDKDKIIAFEMEGAGVCEGLKSTTISTVVIKGVCDYSDSHKNKKWQKHAAARAAACMTAFLDKMRENSLIALPRSRRGSFSSVRSTSTVNSSMYARRGSSSVSELSSQSFVLLPSSRGSSQSSLGQISIPSAPSPMAEKACKDVHISVQEICDEPEGIATDSSASGNASSQPIPYQAKIPAPEVARLLLEACGQPQPFAVASKLLDDHRFDINVKTDKLRTVAHLVLGTAKVGRNKTKMMQIGNCIRFLCHYKANVDSADASGLTPLHICVKTANTLAASVLVKNRVNVNAADNNGWTPLYLLCIDGNPELGLAKLLVGAEAGLNGLQLPALEGRPRDVQREVRRMLRAQ